MTFFGLLLSRAAAAEQAAAKWAASKREVAERKAAAEHSAVSRRLLCELQQRGYSQKLLQCKLQQSAPPLGRVLPKKMQPSPLLVSTVSRKCYDKLSDVFNYLKAQTVEPCTTILDFIAREKMIDTSA